MPDRTKQLYVLLFVLALLVNFFTLNTPFFTDDPGLYASISKELIYKHDFFSLYSYGRDWLDKPHMPFWLIMISFRLFGIYAWTYRLPAMLCFILSLLYTWLFTKKYYGKETAAMAVLILSTSLHVIMSNTDVRAEPYLMAFITGAVYHIAALENRYSFKHLLLAAMLTAFAVMTKGIFVIIAIYGALGGQLLLQKKYSEIFRLKWVLLVLLTIIFTAPEIYGLYIQFDRHPEKVVFGRQHVSGIKWFLWDSQFGRFTNQGPISRKQGDLFFFVHTLLWAFAPWCLLFYFAVYKIVARIIKGYRQPEYYAISGGLILLLLFSLSGFQLPFYTNIIFPLFAIITARLCNWPVLLVTEDKLRAIAQWLYIVALPLVVILLHIYMQPKNSWLFYADAALLTAIVIYISKTDRQVKPKLFFINCAVMLFANLYVNAALYPLLTENKGQLKAAAFINANIGANTAVYSLKDQNNIFQFYCQRPVLLTNINNLGYADIQAGAILYADQETIDMLNAQHQSFKILASFIDYPQENILPAFVSKKTRATTLTRVYIISKL